MRHYLLSLVLLFPLLVPAQTYKALFLGNSYTGVNNLPNLVKQIALSGGDTLYVDNNTPGGYTLQGHSGNATSISKINSLDWDFVVLQDQSQRPSRPPATVASIVYPYAAILDSIIEANDPCTETVFYMTWGRKFGDATFCGSYPIVCTYEGMQQRLRESYLEMGTMNSAPVAPAGMAWKHSREADSTINLWSGDNSHPSLAGSYLTACVFYSTFYRRSPVGYAYTAGLDSTTALFLQGIAASTVFDSMEVWGTEINDPVAEFSTSMGANPVVFTDLSKNATSWQWDFGDGTTSTAQNPVHIYDSLGTYTVTLIIDSGCKQDTLIDAVMVSVIAGVEDELSQMVSVFPNPARAVVQFESQSQLMDGIQVWNAQGQLVFDSDQQLKTYVIPVKQWAHGMYISRVWLNNSVVTQRFLVE